MEKITKMMVIIMMLSLVMSMAKSALTGTENTLMIILILTTRSIITLTNTEMTKTITMVKMTNMITNLT